MKDRGSSASIAPCCRHDENASVLRSPSSFGSRTSSDAFREYTARVLSPKESRLFSNVHCHARPGTIACFMFEPLSHGRQGTILLSRVSLIGCSDTAIWVDKATFYVPVCFHGVVGQRNPGMFHLSVSKVELSLNFFLCRQSSFWRH